MENKWKNKNFFQSLKNAINGIKFVWQYGSNIKIQFVFAIFAIIGAFDRVIGNRLKLGEEFEKGIIAIDACTVYSGKVNVICLEDDLI